MSLSRRNFLAVTAAASSASAQQPKSKIEVTKYKYEFAGKNPTDFDIQRSIGDILDRELLNRPVILNFYSNRSLESVVSAEMLKKAVLQLGKPVLVLGLNVDEYPVRLLTTTNSLSEIQIITFGSFNLKGLIDRQAFVVYPQSVEHLEHVISDEIEKSEKRKPFLRPVPERHLDKQ